jgi:orotidine-5'-phosphate decarboxylase
MPSKIPEIIVALDVETASDAMRLVDLLAEHTRFYKVGSRLFTAEGPGIVREITDRGGSVFIDLKFHDIPATVAGSVRAAAGLGARMMTIHTSGGFEMMRAAAESAADEAGRLGIERPLVVGVTVLTSLSEEDLADSAPDGIAGLVKKLASRAKKAGLDGIVASVQEAAMIKSELGREFKVVTPGIRPAGADVGDQKRVATPRAAMEAGSDFLVVGRPIIKAPSPAEAARAILEELKGS